MRILLLVEPYMNLDKPIVEELERQDHEVILVADRQLDCDWRRSWLGIRGRLKNRLQSWLTRAYEKYWDSLSLSLSNSVDFLLVINGCSFHYHLMEILRKRNPKLRSCLYLWDNSQFYDYYHNAKYFDKVMSYDLADCRKYGASLLPFYWCESDEPVMPNDIDISIVGSNHSNRLNICRSIKNRLPSDIVSDFRVVDTTLPEDDIVTHEAISYRETLDIMRRSRCILDTDRASQTGTTPRLIWAIAMNKKVVTTNTNIVNMPFYNPQQIYIIDRNSPVVPIDFIKTDLPDDFVPYNIDDLRIDRWVNKLLN